jgi:site-specific recombinase
LDALNEIANVPPDGEALGRALDSDAPRHRAFRQLHAVLSKLDADAELGLRLQALESAARWLCSTGAVPEPGEAPAAERPQVKRWRWFTRALERVPAYRTALARALLRTLEETSGLRLFARVGIPGDRGLLNETVDRLSRRLLPEPLDENSLRQLATRLFPAQRDLAWLARVPDEQVSRLVSLLSRESAGVGAWWPLVPNACDALGLLSASVAGIGLSEVIRVRSPSCALRDSPFYRLPRACDELVASAGGEAAPSEPARAALNALRTVIADCREAAQAVVHNLDQRGVSVDVVYRLELITKSLARIDVLATRLVLRGDPDAPSRARDLLIELARARHRELSLSDLLRSNLHLLARKIIERAGHTGEHYITTTRGEYFRMLLSAAGGGFLTAGTTATKYWIGWAHFAPFVEGLLSSINYAGSFLLMQALGFTLATKQPSMTAAALAGSLRESAGHPDLSGLVSTIARITRSQLAAALGNLGMVIPAAIALDALHRRELARPFLDPETASYVLGSLHLTQSASVLYAAFTGVLLWVSSVGAGWLENWAIYRSLPEAIAAHRSGRFVGHRLTAAAARVFSRNISGFGGNVTLGVLLGMTPVLGRFFGLPLDVRHVTLSTGALTLSVCSLGEEQLSTSALVHAIAGIVVIGLMNFGVSFVLALAVALRAREVDRSDRFRLLLSVVLTFVRAPMQFLFPPASGESQVHGPASSSASEPR